MSASINRMRARLQQRNASHGKPAGNGIVPVNITYGVSNGRSIVTFSNDVRQLNMTAEEAMAFVKGVMSTLDALEKGVTGLSS